MILQQNWTVRRVATELPFIPFASNWLKLLLSMLAEPMMFCSTLFIIGEAVIPGMAAWSPALNYGTQAIMSIAPEVILPGVYQQATFAWRHGNTTKAWLLYILCGVFGILTLVTVASFVWKFAAIGTVILFIRCASGIAYTFVSNISDNRPQGIQIAPQGTQPADPDRLEHLERIISELAPAIAQLAEKVDAQAEYTREETPVYLPSTESTQQTYTATHQVHTRPASFKLCAPVRLQGYDVLGRSAEDDTCEEAPQATLNTPAIGYPEVPGVSTQKVKATIDAFLSGTTWRDMPGNYSRTIMPIRKAYEAVYGQGISEMNTDEQECVPR
jgi:hypothetical protein